MQPGIVPGYLYIWGLSPFYKGLKVPLISIPAENASDDGYAGFERVDAEDSGVGADRPGLIEDLTNMNYF